MKTLPIVLAAVLGATPALAGSEILGLEREG